MTTNAILQLGLYVVVLVALVKPLGAFMARVYENKPCGLDKILGPLERLIYRLCGIDPNAEMSWKHYTYAVLAVNFLGLIIVYGLLRLQYYLPLNPQGLAGTSPDLAFNTAVSFATNTNWQSYGGEVDAELFFADARAGRAELSVGGLRHGRAGGADPRIRASAVRVDRQLLVRHHAQHALHPAAAVDCSGAGAGLARRRADVQPLCKGGDRSADDVPRARR